ncbi:uncharacterized protein LOC129610783 [Condylostylus longicornis]|uniref:uncharacterized protein LOC129610783 n=1 Tax=Condylostylus longicornis TaxID=2530218 RepID=UPI00244E18D8|nr:uncharacterized protein LOC129610783 [Condylostylus longicornis]
MNKIFSGYLTELSVHGLKYLVNTKLLVLERILWFILITFSTIFTIYICLDQWYRFKNNPVVLTVEVINDAEDYPYPRHTICLLYDDENMSSKISFTFGIDLTNISYPYKDQEAIDALTSNGKYTRVITESGLCLTSSKANNYQNPDKIISSREQTYNDDEEICSRYMFCFESFQVAFKYKFLAIHESDDIYEYDKTKFYDNSHTCKIPLDLSPVESEEYKPTFCKIECRIKKAMDLCKCKPFFYVIGEKLPLCDIKGLLCLSRTNWYNVTKECECFELCANIEYINQGEICTLSQDDSAKTIVITVPNFSQRKLVVFSIDQLKTK